MKRTFAKIKLKRTCVYCDKSFKKGDVYYKKRYVFTEDGKVHGIEHLICPKCKYLIDNHKERFEKFKKHCSHPLTEDIWTYISGECIMEPYGSKCLACGEWV